MAAMQTIAGVGYPARCFAYTPDVQQPSTWKLRLYLKPGDTTPNPGYVGAAVAALGKGYRGQKVQIPQSDRAAVIAKVRAAWKRIHPGEMVPAVLV